MEKQHPSWQLVLQAVAQALALIAILAVIFLWDTQDDAVDLRVGQVAPGDILAPMRITYVSKMATEAARERAASAVRDIYTPPDPEILQAQLDHARDVLGHITSVREDPDLTFTERVGRVREVPDLQVSDAVIRTALSFDRVAWARTITTTLWAMEKIMADGLRESQLLEVRSRLTTLLSSEILPIQQERVVLDIAHSLITPTSFHDAEATEAAKALARDEARPVERTIERGQAIVRSGDIVTAQDLEELEAFGLLHQTRGAQEIAGALIFAAALVILPAIFIQQLRPGFYARWRRILLICTSMILTIILAHFMIPDHVLLPYLFPMAAVSMLLTLLLEDFTLAVMLTAMLSLAVGFVAGGSLEMTVLNLASGVVASLSILHRERLAAFLRAGMFVALSNLAISLAFRLLRQDYDLTILSQLSVAALLNGILSASFAFATFSWMGRLFGITSAVQLLELARPTQPLLKQLALKSPGTYHHTIIISNMAEQAAEAIGANSLLARIGGYYHDIGKTTRPYFFIENSTPEENIHSRLDPRTSAQIIISHVTDGLELAKKHGLPREIQDIIAQHHGTTLVSYFYQRACQQAAEGEIVDEAEFRYPGPKPQTKEAAIVMLSDVEAAIRSTRPATAEETDRMVRQFINVRLISGQLDECDLTLRDLDLIRESFVAVLKGVFHPRIQYPAEARDQEAAVPRAATAEATGKL